jgi:hypothetical protein
MELDEYERFVGTLMYKFSELEFWALDTLRQRSGLRSAEFTIIVGQPSASEVYDRLEKLAIHQKANEIAAVRDAFAQLSLIATLRNWIVHHGGHPVSQDENGAPASRVLIRLKPPRRSVQTGQSYHLFEPQMLRSALDDLQLVTSILLLRLAPPNPNPGFRAAQLVNGVRNAPWRYRHPALEPKS